jgi:hypothetical protein
MKQGLAIALFCVLFPISMGAQCPTVKVFGPQGVTLDKEIVFRAEIGVIYPKLDYLWQLDKGIILDGQGTPKITVSTFGLRGQTITATVQIAGLPDHCANSSLGIADIGQPPTWCWEDTFSSLKPNEIRGHLDPLFVGLGRNPEQVGLIELRVTQVEKFDLSNSRIQLILKHAKFRKFDHRRLWFVLQVAEDSWTSWTRIKPEAEYEIPCGQCLIIKGEHL